MRRKKPNELIFFLFLPLVSSLLLLATALFQWTLTDWFTFLFMPFIGFAVFVFFIGAMILSLFALILKRWIKPLAIQLVALLLFFFFPFNEVVINYDFSKHLKDRELVIEMVDSGQIKPNVSHNENLIQLPAKYRRLSKGGGDIVIDRPAEMVFFFTYRGATDNFSGFIYSAEDVKPRNENFNGDYMEIKKMKTNWYWVSST